MKFDMGSSTLSTLAKGTDGSHQNLGGLVKALMASTGPIEDKFHGNARVAFDDFKARTDEIADALNGSLAAILTGQSEMDTAFVTGDQEGADNATQAQASANFDGARFSSRS